MISQQSYNKINIIIGWFVFLIASFVFVSTAEPVGSFWDCGEFISCCYKLQLPHTPGAPIYAIIGRVFIVLFGNSPTQAAYAINIMNAFASAFTILFLFWSTTFFAKRLVLKKTENLDLFHTILIMAAGTIGGLAYTFCDSFWYSAVEGEVYAMSSLIIAFVFWAMLKWETKADEPQADHWILLIFLVIGISIGIHLLNLLALPSLVMIYYYRKYKPTPKGAVIAFIIGCIILGSTQVAFIQWPVKLAGKLDILFVNSFALPFFSGFITFFVIFIAALVWLFRWAHKKGKYFLKFGVLCVGLMLIGYSAYFTTLIRSLADPSIDMYNVDNPMTLVGYLSREQYGESPLVYGSDFTDQPEQIIKGDEYSKDSTEYTITGQQYGYDWTSAPSAHLFPRMWDFNNDRNQSNTYKTFSGMGDKEAPTMLDNITYFVNYQCGWMWFRYFMWSFSGKQNDLQGFGNVRDGNWISGISFIDNARLGDQSFLPDSISKDNGAHNVMFMLPFILGILGMIIQYKLHKHDFIVTLILFLFMGLGIVFYLNQSGLTPRERDYIYVASSYVFAIWIGLSVLQLSIILKKALPIKVSGSISIIIGLAVIVLMGSQEWNDHDRSKKTLPLDMAKDYLMSCPPNAFLMTYGDNDTYPLWYAQEVVGIRPDVRVVVNSLFSTDWYTNELRYKINNSAPFDLIFTKEQFLGNRRQITFYNENAGYDQSKYYDLDSTIRNYMANDALASVPLQGGETGYSFPTKKFKQKVNKENAIKSGVVSKDEVLENEITFDFNANARYMVKSDLALYALIASNDWKRPICFTSLQSLDETGISIHTRQRGLIYTLVPLNNQPFDLDESYSLYTKKFIYHTPGVTNTYYDEENRRHLMGMRMGCARLASSLVDAGKIKEAQHLLKYFDSQTNLKYFPYGLGSNRGNQHDYISFLFLQNCYKADVDSNLINKVKLSIKKDLDQQMRYYKSLGSVKEENAFINELQKASQNQPSDLSERQLPFIQDALYAYQMLEEMKNMETNYREAHKQTTNNVTNIQSVPPSK
ncbi:MAG: DUF2723 domain-containing protein [Sediminibacterium sp.]|nr:DUF2723 domain-containing protein [Sediminibacterium sp.]